jgi:hypothetical protein
LFCWRKSQKSLVGQKIHVLLRPQILVNHICVECCLNPMFFGWKILTNHQLEHI